MIQSTDQWIIFCCSGWIFSGDRHKKEMILSFYDIWFLDKYIHQIGTERVLHAFGCANYDTVYALVCFYILNKLGVSHFHDWYEHSYAFILYPKAICAIQRLNELLSRIGYVDSCYDFFAEYITFMENVDEDLRNILIDSIGLLNIIHFPLTWVCTFNGKIYNEVSLLYIT